MQIGDLKEMMRVMGIDVFGTSDCSAYVPDAFIQTPFAITLGVRLSDVVVDAIMDGPTKLYFHHYRTVNAFLDRCALRCAIELQRGGYNALAIAASQTTHSIGIAGDFQHKTAANLAGLGFMGKSGLFISRDFGPRVRFTTVLTDLPLKAGWMMPVGCGKCRACVDACPCGAILGSEWQFGVDRDDIVDADKCSRYMKAKYQMIGRGSVCGICMAVCPYGVKKNS